MVSVLSTGDEVVEASCAVLQPGQIRDSNRSMLLAACAAAGASTRDGGIVRDQVWRLLRRPRAACTHAGSGMSASSGASAPIQPPLAHAGGRSALHTAPRCNGDKRAVPQVSALEAAIDSACDAGADIIVTSGGVSMGDSDHVKAVLEARGSVHFGRVLMKPGKPLTFATLQSRDRAVLFFGLPGACVVPAARHARHETEGHLGLTSPSPIAPRTASGHGHADTSFRAARPMST